MAPRLELYPFRFRDPITGKWTRARYRAERQEIAARYAEWEITGPAELRDVDPAARITEDQPLTRRAHTMRRP